MEANEEKRSNYAKLIKDIKPEKLVYIDQSGIEMSTVKDRGWGRKDMKLLGKKAVNIIKELILLLDMLIKRV